MPKKPPISRKDLKLWQKVANTVTPINGKSAELKALIEKIDQPPPITKGDQPDPDHPAQKRRADPAQLKALKDRGFKGSGEVSSPSLPPLAPLDRREKKRILRGIGAIDARLDLHGMTQREAHNALFGFLRMCHMRGDKHVLVITGKGGREQGRSESHIFAAGPEKGILRRVVPKWLAEKEIRALIVGFEEAHPSLGGAGALHIRLRRRKNYL